MPEVPTLPNRLLEVPPPPPPMAPDAGDDEEDDPNANPDVVLPVADDDDAAPNPEDFPAVPTLAKPPPKPEDNFPMDEAEADPKPKTFLVLGAPPASVGFSVEVEEEAANTVEANGLLLVPLVVAATIAIAIGVVDDNPLPFSNAVVGFLLVEGRVVSAAPASLFVATIVSAVFGAAAKVRLTL